jgi:hypothetical protein
MENSPVVRLEQRTTHIAVFIGPREKALYERLCAKKDATASQTVRRPVRRYVEGYAGRPSIPRAEAKRLGWGPRETGEDCGDSAG